MISSSEEDWEFESVSSPRRKTWRKDRNWGEEILRAFGAELDLKVNKNNTVPLELVVLPRSTNQRI